MRCAHEKHWKSETKTTCKERLKLITVLISSGDNSKLNGNIALIFSSWTARGFWTRSPLPVFFSSLKRGAGCDVAVTWLWTRRPHGLVVRTELEEPGPCTWSSAHDLFWEHSEAPSLPCASVSLPVREVLTHIPGGRDVQTKPWELSGPWSPLSGEDLCLLVTPWALRAHWVAASCLRFPCWLTAKIKREEVAMASTWWLQGRQTGASGAAQGLGNGGAEAGRELGVLGGDTGGSHTCSRTVPVCRGRGLSAPGCTHPGFWAPAGFMGGALLFGSCSLCLLSVACGRQGQVTVTARRGRPRAAEVAALGGLGTVLAQKGRVPKGWAREGAGTSLGEEVEASLSASLSPSLFPLHLCLPPLPPALCRHLIIYIKLTFAEFTQGSVIVFFHRFCITNHENGILSSLTNF